MSGSQSGERSQAATKLGRSRHKDFDRVLSDVESLCETMGPGSRIPTHTELMRRYDASARTMLRALDELQRRGRLVRRLGSGTYVTELVSTSAQELPIDSVSEQTIVVVTMPDRGFFDRAIQLLYDHAGASDLDVVCRLVRPESDLESLVAYPGQPIGYIICGLPFLHLSERLFKEGHRVVHMGAPLEGPSYPFPMVYSDQEQGGYLAGKHLIQLGHRRLLFVHNSPVAAKSLRLKGILRAIADAKKNGRDIQVVTSNLDVYREWLNEPGAMREYFRQSGAPTGAVVWNDGEAIVMMQALARAGIKVPEEISIIGYDDLPQAELMTPKLTTVDGALHQQLQSAVDLLTAPERSIGNKVVLLPALVIRDSTAPPQG